MFNYLKIGFILVVSIIIISCQSEPKQLGNVLHKGNGAEPQTLDPHKAEGVPASNILRDLYESLTEVNNEGKPVLAAASRLSLSADGTIYTFYLRPEARWSNGDPVTAHDFEYGFKRSIDPKTGSKYSMILNSILHAEAIIDGSKSVEDLGVNALDDYTLQITLKAPTPYFLDLLTHSTTYPVHKSSIDQHGHAFTNVGNLITNGAYQLDDWVIQSHISLKRNLFYWNNNNTSIDQVIYHAIEDSTAELNRYRSGELDWTNSIPINRMAWVREHFEDQLYIKPFLGCYYYGFNLTKPPFQHNPLLRKALSLAIDRSIITQKISNAGEIPAYSFVPPGVNHYTTQELSYANFDRNLQIQEAQRLYQKAGYSKSNPLSIEIRYNTSEGHKKIALAIAAMWNDILGVNTTLVNEEWKVYLESRKQKKNTQIFRAGWIGDYNDANTFLELLHSKHGINDSGYSNPSFDALLAQASTTVNLTDRQSILEKAERLMLNEHPIIPIYFYVSKHLISHRVMHFQPNIVDRYYTKNLSLKVATP